MPPTVLFTGSREWTDWKSVARVMDHLYYLIGEFVVLHGGARGLDRIVDGLAKFRGWTTTPVYPNYSRYGRYEAPKRRNIEMLEMKPEYVVGFWDGESTGTIHCLTFAINVFRIPTLVIIHG